MPTSISQSAQADPGEMHPILRQMRLLKNVSRLMGNPKPGFTHIFTDCEGSSRGPPQRESSLKVSGQV